MKLLVCNSKKHPNEETEETYKELFNYVEQVKFMHATCGDLCNDAPVVMVFPEAIFYHDVTKDKVKDLLDGNLEDHKYTLDDLYEDSMEIYRRDPMHRRTVKLFRYQLEKMNDVDWHSVRDVLPMFETKYDVRGENLTLPVTMALLGTTTGPYLPKLIDCLGKEEAFNRIDQYLQDNKYRI